MRKLIYGALLTFGLKRIGLLLVKLFEQPAVKNAVSDVIFTATDRFLYDDREGTQQRLRRRSRERTRQSTISHLRDSSQHIETDPYDHQRSGL